MPNKNALNKNSLYVSSLVDFILDTKPYHVKLTDVVEEYRFFDDINVNIKERLTSKMKIDSAWTYNYFSSANPLYRTMPAHQMVAPSVKTSLHIVGQDENTDLALVPYVYSKKSFDGAGVKSLVIRRTEFTEAFTESVDYFQSHGSFQFQIKQTKNAAGEVDTLWSSTPDDNLLSEARKTTIANALDKTNPSSATNRIRALLDEIKAAVVKAGGHAEVTRELNILYDVLDIWMPFDSGKGLVPALNALVTQETVKGTVKGHIAGVSTTRSSSNMIAAGAKMPATGFIKFSSVTGGVYVPGALEGIDAKCTGPNTSSLPGRQDWSSQYDPNVAPTYAGLLAWLAMPNDKGNLVQLPLPHDRQWFEQQFSNYSSPLFFGMFTDMGIRESGMLAYVDTKNEYLSVTNLKLSARSKDIEEWVLTAVDNRNIYKITGSTSGFVGFVTAGDSFNNGRLSFDTALVSTSVTGATLALTPTRKIVIGEDAPLETWNIIKVNPIAHNRPVLTSTRYGYVQDLNGVVGRVTLLDTTLPTGDLVLTSRGGGVFVMVSLADKSYTATVTVGQEFNDGKLGFTIVKGASDFVKGDRFYISIENPKVRVENLELGYGYDMDPYDDDTTEYPTGGKVGFYYDGRFTDYDLSSLNLQITENAKHGRKWRLRALPDFPLRLIATAPGVPNVSKALPIYYAGRFAIEYSDNDFKTKTLETTIAIGESYSSAQHGISFTLANASRPFVAVRADDNGSVIEGGDIFSFDIVNQPAALVDLPIGLTSYKMPRLIMHSDSFYDAPAADWTVTIVDKNTYTVLGVGSEVYGPITGKIATAGKDAREGYSFKGLGVHFTIVPSTDGLFAGDTFTFKTFDEKPSYLVHGSITGWTAPATVGKYYWNGKIGFKIVAPRVSTFVGSQQVDVLAKSAYTVREDCPQLIYTFVRNSTGYQVTRSDTGESSFASATIPYQDKYLKVNLTGVTQAEFQLVIDAHDYPLWNSADVVIINPRGLGRKIFDGNVVVIEKTEDGRFSLNLPDTVKTADLNPITIDQRFIDTNTRGLPLSQTSPETALFKGWIPLTVNKFDSVTSVAEFSDKPSYYVFKSSATNQTVGTLKGNTFEWDTGFYTKYLPLNAEANLVIQDTGWNDKVSAKITESVKFLLGGGALAEDFMFVDKANVKIVDDSKMNIVSRYNDGIKAIVKDGPFAKFLPGYGNTPYDDQGYDAGQPPDIHSLLSKTALTDDERQNIFDQWNNYLQSDEAPTTEAQWAFMRAALAGDPNPGLVTDDFGYPVVGMGLDIVTNSVNSAKAAITETMGIRIVDKSNLLESNNYDIGLLDKIDEEIAVLYSGSMPPVPAVSQPAATYDTFQTPLTIDEPARIIEVSFNASPAVLATFLPTFSVWLPGTPRPVQITVIDRIKPGVFRFTFARPTAAKIIVG